MEWHVSVLNPTTKRAQLSSGHAPDRETAIRMIVAEGRAMARASDGTIVGTYGNVVIDDQPGNTVPFGDTSLSDDELGRRVQAAIDYVQERSAKYAATIAPVASVAPREPTEFSTPAGDVAQQWGRISRWLTTHHTKVPSAGAPQHLIDDAEARTQTTWPEELKQLFGHVDGLASDAWFPLLPSHDLFGLEQVIDERQVELEVWGEFEEDVPEESDAGDRVGTWLPEFLPFAGVDGNFLFIDSRPGPLHGCVTGFDKVGADDQGPRWISLSAMLTDLADALETGRKFAGAWVPSVVDGQLDWTYEK
ncbi:SMI1/KNR4 family protein [Rhodococcus sp. 114MFTsu3.1]|uniref:SMI1/KNR4 family protein n=1 Tax=Rhodococcus sp. 114MFTsu3.1 TaxID=1172184 RepID=UPI000379DDAE|nr:SMI1/KNR4 family protein [Rhodococcus sp. 114MFTsu3.1]